MRNFLALDGFPFSTEATFQNPKSISQMENHAITRNIRDNWLKFER